MHNAEQKETGKAKSENTILLKKYFYFLGILVIVTAVLVAFTVLSRNTWQSGLKDQVTEILQQTKKDTYTVGEGIDIRTAFSTSGIVYTVKEKGVKETEYAVLLRVATLYGPLPALFLYTPGKEVQFVTFITFGGMAEQQTENISKYSQISYWNKRIPAIVETGLSKGDKGGSKK